MTEREAITAILEKHNPEADDALVTIYRGWLITACEEIAQASRRQALEEGFESGWINAAVMAEGDDLVADVGSDAFKRHRDAAIRSLATRTGDTA